MSLNTMFDYNFVLLCRFESKALPKSPKAWSPIHVCQQDILVTGDNVKISYFDLSLLFISFFCPKDKLVSAKLIMLIEKNDRNRLNIVNLFIDF